MVSPLYKGGYGVTAINAAASTGESPRVVYESLGVFAGAPGSNAFSTYIAHREPSGWSTAPLRAPAQPPLPPAAIPQDYSASLDATVDIATLGSSAGFTDSQGTENEFLLHRTDAPDVPGNWEVAGGIVLKAVEGEFENEYEALREQGASGDLCHILFTSPKPLVNGAPKNGQQLYELSSACGGEPGLRLVALNNQGEPMNGGCPAALGAGGLPAGHEFNAVSADGSEIFITAPTQAINCESSLQQSAQLFVRLDGQRTLEVSRPKAGSCAEVPCPEAAKRAPSEFQGASRDGSRVFFTTSESLVAEDKDKATDLYMATIGCPEGAGGCEPAQREVTSLALVSHRAVGGEAAEVQGVTRIAPDGSRAYFVARGLLSGANVEGQAPAQGADNLYVYDASAGTVAFVADLCSGPEVSGEAEDSRCPGNLGTHTNDVGLWTRDGAQSTDDGRFLVFTTSARLSRHDTDSARDVYRYDAATGVLDRVSVGEAGFDLNGNGDEPAAGAYDATIPAASMGSGGAQYSYTNLEMSTRAISEDGSRIIFETAEPLSRHAENHLVDVYEWHKEPGWQEGVVSMVSGGTAEESDENAVITPSGTDILFTTTQGLVAQDTDGARDVYDARLGGGFPPPPAEPQPCSGDACYGPLTNPAPLLVPGSASQAPGGNLARPPAALPVTSKKATPRCPKGKKLRRGKCVKRAKRPGKARRGGKEAAARRAKARVGMAG
jgi:hypothetical protein